MLTPTSILGIAWIRFDIDKTMAELVHPNGDWLSYKFVREQKECGEPYDFDVRPGDEAFKDEGGLGFGR